MANVDRVIVSVPVGGVCSFDSGRTVSAVLVCRLPVGVRFNVEFVFTSVVLWCM